jgi:hypothetical protein
VELSKQVSFPESIIGKGDACCPQMSRTTVDIADAMTTARFIQVLAVRAETEGMQRKHVTRVAHEPKLNPIKLPACLRGCNYNALNVHDTRKTRSMRWSNSQPGESWAKIRLFGLP